MADALKEKLFETFWKEYPRKEAPTPAKKSWMRLKFKPGEVEQIIAWIKEARLSKQWQDKNFIPLPTTFLNQRRWQGDTPPKKAATIDQVVRSEDSPCADTYLCEDCRDTGRIMVIRDKSGSFHAAIAWRDGQTFCNEIYRCECDKSKEFPNIPIFIFEEARRPLVPQK